jgi:hypothetical protein
MSNEKHSKSDSLLSSAGRANPFTVPNDYFEHLPAEINKRIHARKPKLDRFPFKLTVVVSSIVVCTIAVIIVVYSLKNHNTMTEEEEFLLSDKEIELIISNPELFNIRKETIIEQYISMNIENDEDDEQIILPEEEISRYLEENLNIYIIDEL